VRAVDSARRRRPPSVGWSELGFGPVLALTEGFDVGGFYVLGLLGLGVALFVAVGALSHQHERAFSAAVFYVALGVIGALALSLLDIRPFDPVQDHVVVERLTELALVLAVFAAGLTVERNVSRRSVVSISVLLLVVMPLTIALIALFGRVAMGLSFGAAVVLGAVLAPTDPVLAGDVGLGPPGDVPQGEPRLSLHTEAGINDGLAAPFVLFGLFIADPGGTSWVGEWLWADVLYGVAVAVTVGAAMGVGAARLVIRARVLGLMDRALDGFAALALVLVVYGTAEFLGSYGLLALFVAGFAFRRYAFEHEVHSGVHRGADTAGTFLELLVLLLLGSMLTLDGLGAPGLAGWLLAPLLIVVIRPALVMATTGKGLASPGERLFLGFFGVRGVAALFYAAVVVESGAISAAETRTVVWTAVICVIVSIVVHGTSSTPLTRLLIARR
jgi:NhaP-type Na+/H+ or K+/H+ antiporter